MAGDAELVRVIRGDHIESVHRGHAVICDASGIRESWGDADVAIFPRSSCKMVQALPLVEAGLERDPRRLALACASHSGEAAHVDLARGWLSELGLGDEDLRCGAHWSTEREARDAMVRDGRTPCQCHNNCSGKHVGFLALSRHLGGDPDYVDIDHPVQRTVLRTFEEVTDLDSPAHGIDGCSAPNPMTRLSALGRAMARFATAGDDARGRAMTALRDAMAAHPHLVAGTGRACTDLMAAATGGAVVKTGAEGVYVGILPERGLGIALKITDGTTRAAEAVIATLLVRSGALEEGAPVARRLAHGPIRNWRGIVTGHMQTMV
ncbi:asparaginase [Jannaschia sp. LMIT008]|uniref:asparaginase n=1 Tax=Jannaschia maritima TaxID=3032585 RepID=UPI002810E9F5|nr:asparaginase [Jannaschia sp. LMIT008]